MIMWNIGALAKPLHEQAEGYGYRLKNMVIRIDS